MPISNRLNPVLTRISADSKVTQDEATELVSAAAKGRYTEVEKTALQALLSGTSQFEPAARTALQQFVDTTPTRVDIADPRPLRGDELLEWNSTVGASLFVDGVSYDDVVQGVIGDCYLVSALSALAAQEPKAITDAITDNHDGSYTVRFFEVVDDRGTTKPTTVVVDDDFLVSRYQRQLYARGRTPGEIWGPLLEKAYAQWKGDYGAIGNGGLSAIVFTAITGKSSAVFHLSDLAPDQQAARLAAWLKAGHAITVGTRFSGLGGPDNQVVGNHAYTVLSVTDCDGTPTVRLRNPWGVRTDHNEPNKTGGEIELPMAEFVKLFEQGSVSGVTPTLWSDKIGYL